MRPVCVQAAGAGAAGVAAGRPIRAGNSGGQVLGDRGHYGNAEAAQRPATEDAVPGELTSDLTLGQR